MTSPVSRRRSTSVSPRSGTVAAGPSGPVATLIRRGAERTLASRIERATPGQGPAMSPAPRPAAAAPSPWPPPNRPARGQRRGARRRAPPAAFGTPRGAPPRARAPRPDGLRPVHPRAADVGVAAGLSRRGVGARPQPRPHAGGGRRTAAAARPAGPRARRPGQHRGLEPRRHLRPAAGAPGPAPRTAGHLARARRSRSPVAVGRQPGRPRVRAVLAAAHRAGRSPRSAVPSRSRCRCRAPRSTRAGTASSTGGPAVSRPDRRARTSPSGPATWAWATTPPSSGWSRTGWPSRGTAGGRSAGRPGSGSERCSREE